MFNIIQDAESNGRGFFELVSHNWWAILIFLIIVAAMVYVWRKGRGGRGNP